MAETPSFIWAVVQGRSRAIPCSLGGGSGIFGVSYAVSGPICVRLGGGVAQVAGAGRWSLTPRQARLALLGPLRRSLAAAARL